MHPADDHAGHRIAQLRKIAGITQQRLADMTGYSQSLIKQVEAGNRTATPALVAAVARALHVDINAISGQPFHAELRQDHLEELIDPIRDAIDLYDLGPADGASRPRPVNVLHVVAEDLCAQVRAGKIRQAASVLPTLIEEATSAAYLGGTSEAWGVLGSIYRSSYDVATKLGYQDLAAIALDRMAWAGDRASDPVLAALRQYMRSLVHMRTGRYLMGARLVDAGQRMLGQADNLVERTAIGGQLHLGSAVISARAGDRDTALEHLAEAERAAATTGEVPKLRWVSFGPTNVAAHRVAVMSELQDYAGAVAAADTMRIPATWPASRAARHYVETAAVRLWTGDKDGSLKDLQSARNLAPQQTRYDYTVRETVSALVRAQRSAPGTLAHMAAWVGI